MAKNQQSRCLSRELKKKNDAFKCYLFFLSQKTKQIFVFIFSNFTIYFEATDEDLRRIEKDRRELNAAYDNVKLILEKILIILILYR